MTYNLEGLTEQEKQAVLKILNEYSTEGRSGTYDDLLWSDYKEIPVTIDEFLDNKIYLGKALFDDEGNQTIYPYWREVLRKIFPNNVDTNYNTAVFTGAIGLGKSTIAVIGLLYQLYRMMCLKDPYAFYGIQEIDTITFAFMNITLDAAEGVAWNKCQNMLKSSEWFLDRGTLTKSKDPVWEPPKGIELLVGSKPSHILGRAVFACLDGDTLILTSEGKQKIKNLAGKTINVFCSDENQNVVPSVECTVLPNSISDEEYHIELEDGTIIKCTPTHRFLLKNGMYKEAKDLTEADELADFDM